MDNLFFPIYKKIEEEFIDLSYSIFINRNQIKTYSIKIADLILRTVSECENIAFELCKKEKIRFVDKNGKIKSKIYFPEYIANLDLKYNLKDKYVAFDFSNCAKNVYDFKLVPFRQVEIKEKSKILKNWIWYYAYNKIKHDRNRYFKYANIDNLIYAMAALFLLNNYLLDRYFYSIDGSEKKDIVKEIESMSDLFKVDIMPDAEQPEGFEPEFPNPFSFVKLGRPHATYLLKFDENCETDSDKAKYFGDGLKSCLYFHDEDGNFTKCHPELELKKHLTKCTIVIKLNKVY